MSMSRTVLSLCLALLAPAGCSSTSSSNSGALSQPDLLPPPPPDMTYVPGPYPAGPYGVNEGDTLADVKGKGYLLSPAHTDVADLKLDTIPVDVIHFNPQCTCGVLSQAAIWCGPCNAEQDVLTEAIAADPTLCAYNVLLESTPPGKRAVTDDLVTWNAHQQNFPIVVANINTTVHLPTPDLIPTNVIFNPRTMKILSVVKGLPAIKDIKALCDGAQQ
jgi:hypothetical protein